MAQEKDAVPGGSADLESGEEEVVEQGGPRQVDGAEEALSGAEDESGGEGGGPDGRGVAGQHAPVEGIGLEPDGTEGPDAGREPETAQVVDSLEDLDLEEELAQDDELAMVHAELEQLKDRHLRLAAEFENYRKRVSAEMVSSWVRAQADLAQRLLDGLDDLQRVSQFNSEDTSVEALIEGVDLVERKLFRAMSEAGLEPVEPVGEPFDPNTMEAMMRVPAEEGDLDDTVHQVFQKGYTFKDLMIRPARVSVFKEED